MRHQLWEPAVLELWAAALQTPSMQLAHLECTGPHALGTEFLRVVVEESISVWYAHAKARATLLKARLGPGSTMTLALQKGAYTSKLSGRECSGSSWSEDDRQRRAHQVSPAPPSSTEANTHTHGAHTTHTAPPVYLYFWVDIPAVAFW